ncbi:MAG: DUF1289 domain-containing protein [Xanthomonadales bacterium]|nr:DUF1289 domain-containing protein [Xanthomonadales bacterium]
MGVCTLDADGHCMGCFRTAEEIQDWSQLNPSERREIMETLHERAAKA